MKKLLLSIFLFCSILPAFGQYRQDNISMEAGDIRTGEEKAQYIVDYTIDSKLTQVPVKKDTSKDEIREGETSETTSGENERYIVTLTDDKGNKQEQVVDKFPATIEDKSGAIYEVDKEGNIRQVSSKSDIKLDDNTKYKQDTTVVAVRFEKTDNTRYALDVYTDIYSKVTEYEREYIVSETEPIRASAKLMLPGTSDEIFVKAIPQPEKDSQQKFDPTKVHFVTESQTEYKAEYDSQKGGWTLNLVAPPANDGQLVYVVYDKGNGQYGTLATLKVLTYEPKEVNVMLVPVNKKEGTHGIDEAAIEREVNAIYNNFGVTVNIKVSDKEFEYTPLDGSTFQVDGTGLFETRTADMKTLEDTFMATGEYNDQTVYLFVMDKPSNVPDTKGDMPRDSRMGYLFPSYDAHTIAHEIGHGVFNLKHPFAKGILTNQFNKGELKDNLMDYPIGNGLAKLQWDALHTPGIVIGLFEKDGDAMSAENNYIILEQDGVFFTPAGNPFTLKAGSKIYAACMDYKRFPSWAVYIFESDDKTYNTNYRDNLSAGINFDCYYQKDNQKNKYPLPADVKGKATFIRFDKLEGNNLCITLLQEEADNIYHNTGSSTISFSRKPQTDTLIEIDKSNSLSTSSCPDLLDEAKQQVSNNSNSTSSIEDKANKLTSEQREYLKNKLESIKSQTGVSWKIIITGNNSDKKAAEEEGAGSKQPILHLHFEENGEINGNIYGGDKSGYIPINNDFIQKLITPLRPLEGAVGKMLEGLSFIIGKASIPDKYYNPKSKDGYDDILAVVYSAADGNYETAQIEIAFVCGLWNGLVGAIQALPDGANLVNDGVVLCMDAIFNKGTARQDIKDFWEADKWEKIKEVAGLFYQNIKEEVTDNPPMISYYTGRIVFDVATIYLSVAKVGKLNSIINAIDKFDIFAQALGKVMKATGVVIRQSGRLIDASLQSGYTFMRISARSGNLYCGIPIPIGEGGTKAYKEAVEKFKEKWNKGVINAEEIIVKADDAGNPLLDKQGRKVGYYEQDGEKIFVLLDESAENLPEGVVDNVTGTITDVTTARRILSGKYGQQIIDDFADNSDMLIKLVNDEKLADSWNALNKAGRSTLRKNPEILEKAAVLMKNNKYGFTSGKMEAFARLHAETGAACGECINSFEKTLENLLGLENKLDNAGDFAKIMDDLTATHGNRTNNLRAADWAIEVANQPDIKGKIKAFDYKPDGESFSIDIQTQSIDDIFYYIECKNYSGTQNFLKESGNNFVSQLVNRLSIKDVTRLDQVTFYFHPRYQRNLKEDVIEALKVKKDLLELLIKNGRLQKLLPDEIINTSDDFINILNTKNNVYNALFK